MAWYGKTTSISRHCFEWAFKRDEEPRPSALDVVTHVGRTREKMVKRLAGEIICSLHPSKLIDDHNSHDGRRDYAA